MAQARIRFSSTIAQPGVVYAVKWPGDEEFFFAACSHVDLRGGWARFVSIEDHTSVDYKFNDFDRHVAVLEPEANVEVLEKSKFYLHEKADGTFIFVVCDNPSALGFTQLPCFRAVPMNMKLVRSSLFEIAYHWEEADSEMGEAGIDRAIIDLTSEDRRVLLQTEIQPDEIELVPNVQGWPSPDSTY